jgi:hypothetical protein
MDRTLLNFKVAICCRGIVRRGWGTEPSQYKFYPDFADHLVAATDRAISWGSALGPMILVNDWGPADELSYVPGMLAACWHHDCSDDLWWGRS